MNSDDVATVIASRLRTVPDFPKPGINFRDITPLLVDARAFGDVIEALSERYRGRIDAVAGIEARGFFFAAPLAVALGVGMVAIRKPGKLPPPFESETYELEYGKAEVNVRDVPAGRVLLLDDILATGGTARAATSLLQRSGATVPEVCFIAELTGLGGRELLTDTPVHALAQL